MACYDSCKFADESLGSVARPIVLLDLLIHGQSTLNAALNQGYEQWLKCAAPTLYSNLDS